MEFDLLSKQVIGYAIEVHKELGPGLLESTYEKYLLHELQMHHIKCQSQVTLPVEYKGIPLDAEYPIDLIIEESLIVELKSVDSLLPIHSAQLLTYMKLAGVKTGFLVNFNCKLLKSGIKRLVL